MPVADLWLSLRLSELVCTVLSIYTGFDEGANETLFGRGAAAGWRPASVPAFDAYLMLDEPLSLGFCYGSNNTWVRLIDMVDPGVILPGAAAVLPFDSS